MMLRYIFRNSKIAINIFHDVLCEPKPDEIQEILIENHSNPASGHSGYHRTLNRIKQFYKWKNMKKDVKLFCKNCELCQKNKLVRKKHRSPMEITSTSSKPFERIALDIVGPLTLSESGNKYILTLQDDLTKFSQAYAIPNHESFTVAETVVHKFICNFGLPESILTDQGKYFMSKLFSDISKLFKIKKINSTAYHPETNGALERSQSTLINYLKNYINEFQTDWDNWLNFAIFSYNTTVHTSTKFSPFELVFGNKARIPSHLTQDPIFKYTYDDYIDELTLKFQKSHQLAKENLIKSKLYNKTIYDKKSTQADFKVGDKVYLLNELSKPGQSKKLNPAYTGPYDIIEINSDVNCRLLIKNKKVKVHFNRLNEHLLQINSHYYMYIYIIHVERHIYIAITRYIF